MAGCSGGVTGALMQESGNFAYAFRCVWWWWAGGWADFQTFLKIFPPRGLKRPVLHPKRPGKSIKS